MTLAPRLRSDEAAVRLRASAPNLAAAAVLVGLGVWAFGFDGRVPTFLRRQPPAEAADAGVRVSAERDGPDSCARRFDRRRVEFPSDEAVRRAGIVCGRAEVRDLADRVSANGTVHYNHTRIAHLTSRVRGVVREVHRHLGQRVKENDVLAVVDSREVGEAKSALLRALVQVDIKRKVFENLRPESAPAGRIREAEAELRQVRIELQSAEYALRNLGIPVAAEALENLSDRQLRERVGRLGLPESYAHRLARGGPASTNLVPILAPFDGTVVGRDIVVGEIVGPPQALRPTDLPALAAPRANSAEHEATHPEAQFVIADLRKMEIHLGVRPQDIARLRRHQAVHFVADGVPGLTAEGEVEWISTEVDEKTRTVPIHVEADNPGERLRAHLFGTGEVVVRTAAGAVAVPAAAVCEADGCRVVFVRQSPTAYEARLVRTGVRDGGFVQIEEGVRPEEEVVTAGSRTLADEIFSQPDPPAAAAPLPD